MLTLPSTVRLFLYQHPVSMRKSFEGLSSLIEELFPGELFSGALFIFLNRQKDHLKILSWDGDGFLIYFKRLEKGRFTWRWNETSNIDRRQFLMLLEGVSPKRVQKRFSL